MSKLRPARIGKIGVANQNDVAIGAVCELKHVEGNLRRATALRLNRRQSLEYRPANVGVTWHKSHDFEAKRRKTKIRPSNVLQS